MSMNMKYAVIRLDEGRSDRGTIIRLYDMREDAEAFEQASGERLAVWLVDDDAKVDDRWGPTTARNYADR